MAHQLDPLSLAFLAFAVLLLASGHMVNGSSNVGDDLVGTLDEVDWEKRPPGADGIDTRRDGEAYPAFVFSGEVRQKNVGGKSSCNGGVVGHKYQSNHPHGHGGTTQSKGRIARMKFTKKRDNTVLRVTFSENIRVMGRGVAVRWFITVDDQECVKPSKLDIVMYQSDPHENSPIPSVLVGICQATAAGQIKKGTHNIDVNIGATSYPLGTPLSGFYSTTFFEVQEVCPEF
ncbi:uncharacterized protein LOC135826510 isoform X2 [Sycon ciliatum]|uniref:uncharacterized protein LOC135826510 isoform X2 n=1 Tax=Sycon ciliatum TaxID=27933 RepID=UPI0031F69991